MHHLTELRHLDLSCNRLNFTAIPKPILKLANLQNLYLSDNGLNAVDDDVANLSNLQILALRGNKLTWISERIGKCKFLQELHLQDNQLRFLPPSLGSELGELNVLKLVGNPWIVPISDQLRLGPDHVKNYISGKTYGIVYKRYQASEKRRCLVKTDL